METITIGRKDYTYVVNYNNDETLRASFNKLTERTYGFNFENWYKAGYWDERSIPYALIYNNEVASHITANVIDFMVKGEKKRFVQLGTVMTDEAFRNQGLSRVLMERVLFDWEENSDIIYLFANDSVLDFYPKFGFVPVNEYQASKQIPKEGKPYPVRKMDLDNKKDYDLLLRLANMPAPMSQLSMQHGISLVMFYCRYFDRFTLGGNLYYIQDLDTIAVAEYEGSNLILLDLFSSKLVSADEVAHSLASAETTKLVLGFTPNDIATYEMNLYKEEDLTLFVPRDKASLFDENKLMFSSLSHT